MSVANVLGIKMKPQRGREPLVATRLLPLARDKNVSAEKAGCRAGEALRKLKVKQN